ncbi:unnamed protein product [Urochloa decumbens]|uniref:Uncharacterized protein n=1 Tax=Urochloa decumbens TaxID=240449 RepID=A0ABC8YFG3_9POAL
MELEICVACIDKSSSSLLQAEQGMGEEESSGHYSTVTRHVAAKPSATCSRDNVAERGREPARENDAWNLCVCWVDCGPGRHDSDHLLLPLKMYCASSTVFLVRTNHKL